MAVNALVHAINTALSEALVLAEKAGVDRALVYEVLIAGAGGAPFVHYKEDAFLHPESAPVAFSLDLVTKDLGLIPDLAGRVGAPMSQASANLAVAAAAIEAGLGDRDMSVISDYLRSSRPGSENFCSSEVSACTESRCSVGGGCSFDGLLLKPRSWLASATRRAEQSRPFTNAQRRCTI